MEIITKQEYMCILLELELLQIKFVSLEQENQKFLGDLQQVSAEKAQQDDEHATWVQLKVVVASLRQQG